MLTVPQEYRLNSPAEADHYFRGLPLGVTIYVGDDRWMKVGTSPHSDCHQLVCLSGVRIGVVCHWSEVFDSREPPFVFSLGDCSA
jgi:hypothetical protein